jgi:hypothetical protein
MTPDEFIKQFGATTKSLMENSRSVDKSWHGVSQSVDAISRTFEKGWGAAIAKQFGKQGSLITGLSQFQKMLQDPAQYTVDTGKLLKDREFLKARFKELDALRQRGSLTAADAKERADTWARLVSMTKESKLMVDINNLQLQRLTYAPMLLGMAQQTMKFADQQQAALMQANAALGDRYRLMRDIAQVQRATGASAETLADATAAATKYGLEMQPAFKNDLDLMVKMKEGMGVSSDNSASLLASLRLMGQPSKNVADAIARIKADTGLAADEATRLAKQITIAMSIMAPGGNVAGVIEKIGRLEGASVQLGIASGKITDMMTGWTKQSGLMSVGMLGLDPGFMKDQTTTMMGFQKMVEFTEQQLKATEGNAYARQAVLEQFAEIFGTTTEVIANGRAILNEYNKQASTATTVQQEWQKQTSSFAKSWDKLKNQFAGLIHGALLPLVNILQVVVDAVSSVTTAITESKYALWGISGLLGVGFIKTLVGLGGPIKILFGFVSKFTGLAGPISKLAAHLPAFGKFFGSFSGLVSGGALRAIATVFGPIAAAGSLGYMLGRVIGTLTPIDRWMTKLFTSKVFGLTETKDDPMRSGSISLTQWWKTIRQMSAEGVNETLIGKYAEENIKFITEVQKVLPEFRERAAGKLQQQYIEERLLRQRMRELQGWPETSDAVSKDAMKRTEVLIEMEKLARIQAAMIREGTEEAKRERARLAKEGEEKKIENSFKRVLDRTMLKELLEDN